MEIVESGIRNKSQQELHKTQESIMGERKQREVKKDTVKKQLISGTCPLLPIDMITEILTWLPAESLLRCKCVCKEWYSLIQNWSFIHKHWVRGSHIIHILEDKQMDFMHSCGGLVLEKCRVTEKLRIWNPSTQQILDLPSSCWRGSSEVISLLPGTGTCKVVSVKDEGWAILTLGSDVLSWRILKAPISNEHDKDKNFDHLLFTYKAFHYIKGVHCGSSISKIEVESLDFATEGLRRTSLPQGFCSNLSMVTACLWDDCLALTYMVEEDLNILVLEDHMSGRWGTKKIVFTLKFMKENQDFAKYSIVRVIGGNRMVFHSTDAASFFTYDMKSGELNNISLITPEGKVISDILRPSLITFKGMQPEGKE